MTKEEMEEEEEAEEEEVLVHNFKNKNWLHVLFAPTQLTIYSQNVFFERLKSTELAGRVGP
jgi:hypothetical protein